MSDLSFDDLRWLHLLWVVLALAALGVYGIWRRQRALATFAAAGLLPRLTTPTGWAGPLLRLALVSVALAALVAALVGPRWGAELRPVVRRNIDVLVLLDVSRSMLAEDIAPNRLERSKLAIRDDLLPALGGDRIGLITFAGDAQLACPLTIDYGSFRLALDDVSIRSAARGGTLIGDAIRLAGRVLDDEVDSHKVILLITDGEDQESFPVEAAAAVWEEQRIPIIAIALGDPQHGARIPLQTSQGKRYLTYQGEEVWTKADFRMLEQVAGVSDQGIFLPVGTSNFDLDQIYRSVARAIRFEEDTEQQRYQQPARYHPFAVLALVLIFIDSFLRDGPRRAVWAQVRETQKEAA